MSCILLGGGGGAHPPEVDHRTESTLNGAAHTLGNTLSPFIFPFFHQSSLSGNATHRHSHELFQEENINLWSEIIDFKRGEYAVPHLGRALDVGEVSVLSASRNHQHDI